MAELKYAVWPGQVHSENDGDRHYVTFGRLVQLYGRDPRECLRVRPEWGLAERWLYTRGLIWLYPQQRGEDYEKIRRRLDGL